MTPEEFVSIVRKEVLDMVFYTDYLNGRLPDQPSTPRSNPVIDVFLSLDASSRQALLKFFRLVMANVLSELFAVLDGVRILEDYRDDFLLTDVDGNKLNGDLVDIFLAQEEEESSSRDDG